MTALDALLTISLIGGYLFFAIGAVITARAIVDHVKRAKGRAGRISHRPVTPSHTRAASGGTAAHGAPASDPEVGAHIFGGPLGRDSWRPHR